MEGFNLMINRLCHNDSKKLSNMHLWLLVSYDSDMNFSKNLVQLMTCYGLNNFV